MGRRGRDDRGVEAVVGTATGTGIGTGGESVIEVQRKVRREKRSRRQHFGSTIGTERTTTSAGAECRIETMARPSDAAIRAVVRTLRTVVNKGRVDHEARAPSRTATLASRRYIIPVEGAGVHTEENGIGAMTLACPIHVRVIQRRKHA